jgi:hypothetical protein
MRLFWQTGLSNTDNFFLDLPGILKFNYKNFQKLSPLYISNLLKEVYPYPVRGSVKGDDFGRCQDLYSNSKLYPYSLRKDK